MFSVIKEKLTKNVKKKGVRNEDAFHIKIE